MRMIIPFLAAVACLFSQGVQAQTLPAAKPPVCFKATLSTGQPLLITGSSCTPLTGLNNHPYLAPRAQTCLTRWVNETFPTLANVPFTDEAFLTSIAEDCAWKARFACFSDFYNGFFTEHRMHNPAVVARIATNLCTLTATEGLMSWAVLLEKTPRFDSCSHRIWEKKISQNPLVGQDNRQTRLWQEEAPKLAACAEELFLESSQPCLDSEEAFFRNHLPAGTDPVLADQIARHQCGYALLPDRFPPWPGEDE